MSKQLSPLSLFLIGTQLAGCSTVRDYIPNTIATQLYQAAPALVATPILQYDFIEPRRTDLPPATTSQLNSISDNQQRFTYYSASGFKCYTLSLTSLRSACYVNGRWEELAPILNNHNE